MTGPFRQILVPLDGSRLAEVVLPAAAYLAARGHGRVTLLHVLERGAPATVHGEPHLDDPAEAEAYLRSVAARLTAEGVEVGIHVHPNEERDVAQSIAAHVAELGADLVVIATHGSGGLRGFLFGRIAQQVLRRTTVPVLLIKPPDTAQAPVVWKTVLVPLDGTREAEAALPYARALAEILAARLHLTRVVPTVATVRGKTSPAATFVPTATAALLDIEQEEASRYLAAVRDRALAGLAVTLDVRRGDVVDEIAQAAVDSSADLVVLSTHGRAGIEGIWSGSTAAKLLSRLDRPFLLIRVDTGTPEQSRHRAP